MRHLPTESRYYTDERGQHIAMPKERTSSDDDRTSHAKLHQEMFKEGALINATVSDILRELQLDRECGTIRPFVEGEPIGRIPDGFERPKTWRRKKRIKNGKTGAFHTKHFNERRERQRAEMLTLRKQNDEVIDSILGRKF